MTTIYLCAAVPRFGNTPAGSMSQSSGPVLFRTPLSYVTSLFFYLFSSILLKGETKRRTSMNYTKEPITHTQTQTQAPDPPLLFPPIV